VSLAAAAQTIEDSLRQLSERQANHEGRLRLVESSESSDMAEVKEHLVYLRTTVDLILAAMKLDEKHHEATHG
jgi:hypothetical protein